jgi:MFS family permease
MKLRTLPPTIWVLGLASLFTDVSSEMIHAVLPMFLVYEMGAGASTVGLIDGIGESVASVFKLFSGALSDHFGRRKPLVVLGYGLSSIVKVLFALATSPGGVLLARVLDRLGKGIRTAPRDALVADVTDASVRGAAYGLRQSLDSIGAFIGPLLAMVVLTLSKNDYRQVFWLALLPGLVTVLLLVLGIREPEKVVKSKSGGGLQWGNIGGLGRGFWFLFVVALVFTLGNSSDSFILLKMKAVGVNTNLIPLVFVAMNLFYSGTAYPAGKLADRIGKKRILLASFILYSMIYLGFALSNAAWQIWLLVSCYGIYLGLSQGTLLALISERVPQESRGTAFGLLNLSLGLGLLPASLLAGWLWDNVSPEAAFLAGTAFSSIAFLGLCFDRFPRSQPDKKQTEK